MSELACPLMQVKNFLVPLGITAAASANDAESQKKILGSGSMTLIISIEEMNDIMKIIQALEVSKIIQSGGFLGSLLSELAGPLMKVAIPLEKNV